MTVSVTGLLWWKKKCKTAIGKQAGTDLDVHEEVGAVLELVPSVDEGLARGIDGGVGVGGGVELPDLAAGVGVRRAEPAVD
jgi:hypothetical protein